MIASELNHIKTLLPSSLSDTARVWIYQAEDFLSAKEIEYIQKACERFIPAWQAHGKNLKADYRVLYDRFICLFVDESAQNATGCSIDSSVHFIQKLEQELGKSLMQRTQVIYFDEDKRIHEIHMNLMSENIDADTIVANNLVKTLGEMKTSWLIPAKDSWHARML